MPFERVRLDTLHTSPDGEVSKYRSPKGTRNYPYRIPGSLEMIKSEKRIVLTEGEKKAICANKFGFPTVGLAGPYGWKTKERDEIVPELAEILQKGYRIDIVWDSDAFLNPSFADASYRLCMALWRHGCITRVAILSMKGTEKVGLDDFLIKEGREAFEAILDSTVEVTKDSVGSPSALMEIWVRDSIRRPMAGSFDFEPFLSVAITKGFVDGVSYDSRMLIARAVGEHWTRAFSGILDVAVEVYLERHSGLPNGASAIVDNLKEGDIIRLKSSQKVRIKEIRKDKGFCWVERLFGERKSWPMDFRELVDVVVMPPDEGSSPTALAQEYLKERHGSSDFDNCGLRFYRGDFYQKDGANFKKIEKSYVESDLMSFIQNHWNKGVRCTSASRNNILSNILSTKYTVLPSDLDAPMMVRGGSATAMGNVVMLENGYVNLDDIVAGKSPAEAYREADDNTFCLEHFPVHFDPNAQCPEWIMRLGQILPEDGMVDLLQEIFGYCLTKDLSLQKFFMLVGEGCNGKSFVTEVLTFLLGKENVSNISVSQIGERFCVWMLTEKRANIATEMPSSGSREGKQFAEDRLKAITGGDHITVEKKNRETYSAKPTAKLFFCCNERPVFQGKEDGLWRRLVAIPFNQQIQKEDRVLRLSERVAEAELSGILNWAIQGYKRLMKNGDFSIPEALLRYIQQYREESNTMKQFTDECLQDGDRDDTYPVDDAYQIYQKWCEKSGYRALGKSQFGTQLKRVMPKVEKSRLANGRYVYRNVSTQDHAKSMIGGIS